MMKTTFMGYDSYKNSDVEWVGKLPTIWNVKRLKEILCDVVYGISVKTIEFGKYEVLGMGDIYEGKITFPKKRFIDDVQVDLLLKKDDLLYNRTNSIALVGKVGLIEEDHDDVTFASYLIRLRVNSNQCTRYLWYLLNSEYFITYSRSNAIQTANQANLSSSKLKQFKIVEIDLDFQKAIADYLDTKTNQIDQKIDLLTQKATQYGKLKQSLINETVTRGLDKIVAMKDSGVEWIGDVPEHWLMKRVKEVSMIFNGATPKSSVAENWDGNYPWVTTDDLGKLNSKFITDSKRKITKIGYNSCGASMCPIGSVVISGRAPIGHIGILAIEASTNQGCKTLVLNPRFANNLFAFYSLLSSKSKLEALGRGTTFIELSTKELGLFTIPLPPLPEQKAIADYLDTKTADIDRIIETINIQINKLKELRKTLINDVVTGKIRVDVKEGAV